MTVLPELEAQLRGAARRTQPAASAGRFRRLRSWPIAVLVLGLSGASLATAAVQLIGEPAPKTGPSGTRNSGPGLTLPASVRVLDLRVADPDGGPPWGLRVHRTTRRAACWQVGRVVAGRLGILGGDGRFHELPVQHDSCRPLDARGHLFAFQQPWALPDGRLEPWSCSPGCARGNVRLLRFGFLGPEAVSIRAEGEAEQPLTRDGNAAFLLVERVHLDELSSPAPIVVTYRDASRQTLRDDAIGGPGYRDLATALPAPAKVRRKLQFTGRRRGKDMIYTLRFRAPVATRRYGVHYRIVINGPGSGRRCADPMRFAGFDTPGDVRAGQRLTFKLTPGIQVRYGHGWCRGSYRGVVILHDAAHVVGRFSFDQR